MTYNPNIHHRRSIRLKGYDYSQEGLYFVTICCQEKQTAWFGDIVDGQMILNDAGRIVEQCWLEIPQHFPQCGFVRICCYAKSCAWYYRNKTEC